MTEAAETKELLASQMSWEERPPEHSCWGFLVAAGNVRITTGYAVWREAVLLHASIAVGSNEYTGWRRFWAPHDSALDAAESLCGDAEHYLTGTLGMTLREDEDQNFDDFLEHLHLRITNGFN